MDILVSNSGDLPDVNINSVVSNGINLDLVTTDIFDKTAPRIDISIYDRLNIKPTDNIDKEKVLPQTVMLKPQRGEEKVSQEIYEKRLSVCNNCEFRDKKRCKHMGCNCDLAIKAWLKNRDCPMKKWEF